MLAYATFFRLRLPSQKEPPEDALVHKSTAVQCYRDALNNEKSNIASLTLLDTALLLWQLEVSSVVEVLQARRPLNEF